MVERYTYHIDAPRLLAQWVALACLTTALYVVAGGRVARKSPENP